jgi:hypothetical protein
MGGETPQQPDQPTQEQPTGDLASVEAGNQLFISLEQGVADQKNADAAAGREAQGWKVDGAGVAPEAAEAPDETPAESSLNVPTEVTTTPQPSTGERLAALSGKPSQSEASAPTVANPEQEVPGASEGSQPIGSEAAARFQATAEEEAKGTMTYPGRVEDALNAGSQTAAAEAPETPEAPAESDEPEAEPSATSPFGEGQAMQYPAPADGPALPEAQQPGAGEEQLPPQE